ncbi:MAG TPA: glycosyltransferase [Tepidisphaeraceae bacterium]|nr:glycosyltransferase [Tepidisphaeraceae bacterium]
MPRPANLPVDRPILGSVGQINATYDWEFVAELAASLPEARLCFAGNIEESDQNWRRDFVNLLERRHNFLFLDPQPHEQIPAYMQHFDISMCYLRADDSGNRRSPLRLYDYLTTQKPVISTPIREAYEHLPHIHIANSAKEAAVLARRILAGELPVDLAARKQYIGGQTWATRATQLLEELVRVPKLAGCYSGFTPCHS